MAESYGYVRNLQGIESIIPPFTRAADRTAHNSFQNSMGLQQQPESAMPDKNAFQTINAVTGHSNKPTDFDRAPLVHDANKPAPGFVESQKNLGNIEKNYKQEKAAFEETVKDIKNEVGQALEEVAPQFGYEAGAVMVALHAQKSGSGELAMNVGADAAVGGSITAAAELANEIAGYSKMPSPEEVSSIFAAVQDRLESSNRMQKENGLVEERTVQDLPPARTESGHDYSMVSGGDLQELMATDADTILEQGGFAAIEDKIADVQENHDQVLENQDSVLMMTALGALEQSSTLQDLKGVQTSEMLAHDEQTQKALASLTLNNEPDPALLKPQQSQLYSV